MATVDKVRELIAKQLNKSVDEVTEEAEVVKDLGADSLDVVEMLAVDIGFLVDLRIGQTPFVDHADQTF